MKFLMRVTHVFRDGTRMLMDSRCASTAAVAASRRTLEHRCVRRAQKATTRMREARRVAKNVPLDCSMHLFRQQIFHRIQPNAMSACLVRAHWRKRDLTSVPYARREDLVKRWYPQKQTNSMGSAVSANKTLLRPKLEGNRVRTVLRALGHPKESDTRHAFPACRETYTQITVSHVIVKHVEASMSVSSTTVERTLLLRGEIVVTSVHQDANAMEEQP